MKNIKESDWTLENLDQLKLFAGKKKDLNGIIADIYDIVKSSISPMQINDEKDKNCYAVLAYDLLLDEDLNVWLLEINAKPGNLQTDRPQYDWKMVDEIGQLTVDVPFNGMKRTLFHWKQI